MNAVTIAHLVARGAAELVTGPFGTQLAAHEYVDEGTPVINVRNVGFGDVRTADLEYLDDETAERLARHRLREGDIVFGRKGAVERHAFISSGESGWIQGSDCIRLRLDPRVMEPRFVSFAFRTEWHKRWMQNHCSSGATMASLNQDILRLLEIPSPPLIHQRQVSELLGTFDDLIETNRRRIEILEEMAGLVYREWFVHFRFPGHEDVELVDSDLGPIPEGWETETLADAAHLVMGQSPKSEYYNEVGEGLPFHQGVTNFGTRYPVHKTYCSQENRVAEEGDILLSVRAPVGRINVAPDRLVIGRGLAALRSRRDTQVFLFETLREVFAKEDSMGGGTIFKAVTKTDLERIGLLRPPARLVEEFEDAVGPTFELVRNLTSQVRVLSEARDLLLPRLISGELDVTGLELDLEPVA